MTGPRTTANAIAIAMQIMGGKRLFYLRDVAMEAGVFKKLAAKFEMVPGYMTAPWVVTERSVEWARKVMGKATYSS